MSAVERDPAGLLQRVPEMERLAEAHPTLRKAIEAGRPHAAYRALIWIRLLGKAGQDSALIAQLLATRRLFIQPLNGAPAMLTYNGIGARPYGRAEPDAEDGSHILTLYLTLLYVPVYPFGSYLVRPAPSGGWTFFGRVPLSRVGYAWQRALGVLGLIAVLFGAYNASSAMRYNTVQVVNALPFPVSVRVGALAPVTVPSKQVEKVKSKVGVQDIVVLSGSRVLERGQLEVKRGYDVDAWNVLGAAPLYRGDVVYTAEHSSAPKPEPRDPEFFCGEQNVLQDGVDYAFEKPPESISMGEHEDLTHRSRFGLADFSLLFCPFHLANHGKLPVANELASSLARATNYDFGIVQGLSTFFKSQGEGKAELELIDLGRKQHDDQIEYHRMYQSEAVGQGHRTDVVTEYRARTQAHPESADDAYLFARILTGAEADRVVAATLARFPQHPYLLRSAAYRAACRADFAEVERDVDALHALDTNIWQNTVGLELQALAATGKVAKARELVRAFLERTDLDRSDRFEMVVNAELLGHFEPVSPATAWVDSLHGENQDDSAAMRLDARLNGAEPVEEAEIQALKEEAQRVRLELLLRARSDPPGALSRIATMKKGNLEVRPAVWLLLFSEAVRLDEHHPALPNLEHAAPYGPAVVAALAEYVRRGTASEELEEIEPDVLAAADFVRSRGLAADAPEHKALWARAERADPLHGVVSAAMNKWPQ